MRTRIAQAAAVVVAAVAAFTATAAGPASAQGAAPVTRPAGATFKTMCAFTRPVRCEHITHDGAPGSNVIFSRFDPHNAIQQDWNLVKVINPATHKNLVTRTWPPAAQWIRNKYRGKPVYMNVAIFRRTCQGANGPPDNNAPMSHCHGPRSRGVVWIVLGQIMHKAALLNVRESSNARIPIFLAGIAGPGVTQPTLIGTSPGCGVTRFHVGHPCNSGLKWEFWRRFGG